jgi:nitrite reductase (NO-forming)
VEVPGTFIIVDHSIFRAFNKGALGMLKVTGPDDKIIFSGKQFDGIYLPEGSAIQSLDSDYKAVMATSETEQIAFGKRVYEANCQACHQAGGEGIPGAFPPLAQSDYLNADPMRGVSAIVNGLTGPITVNGKTFNGVMPAMRLTDAEIANVITFILNNWGNKGGAISAESVSNITD